MEEMIIGVGIDEISQMNEMGTGVPRCFGGVHVADGCLRSQRW